MRNIIVPRKMRPPLLQAGFYPGRAGKKARARATLSTITLPRRRGREVDKDAPSLGGERPRISQEITGFAPVVTVAVPGQFGLDGMVGLARHHQPGIPERQHRHAGLANKDFRKLMGVVEVDETYIGGDDDNRHSKNKKGKGPRLP